jgi:hypothetical protein
LKLVNFLFHNFLMLSVFSGIFIKFSQTSLLSKSVEKPQNLFLTKL